MNLSRIDAFFQARTRDHPETYVARPDKGVAKIPIAVAMGAAGLLFLGLLAVPSFFGASQLLQGGIGSNCTDTSQAGVQPPPSGAAGGIPSNYLENYKRAGKGYGIPWNVIAGIGKIETSHGQSNLPGVHSGENFAGAGGPMQFLQPTWNAYGVDGDKDGKKNRYDPDDAIPGAANYLKSSGAPKNMKKAIWAYNHSWDYVNNVLAQAKRYADGDFTVVEAGGGGVECSDVTGLGTAPNATIAKMVKFAMAQVGKNYVYGGNGPDVWDCSGLIQGLFRHVGLQVPRIAWDQWTFGKEIPRGKEQPGDLVFFMNSPDTGGPEKPGHVAFVVGKGKSVNARCTACKPGVAYYDYTKRPDIRGFTRPFLNPSIIKQLAAQGND